MPTIDELGEGMYIKDPVRVFNDGRWVTQHKDPFKPKWYSFPKQITWDTVKDLHIYHGVPIVREFQFLKAITSELQSSWHRVYVEQAPVFEFEGKRLVPDNAFLNTFYVGVRTHRDPVTGTKDSSDPREGDLVKFEFNNGDKATGHGHVFDEREQWVGRVVTRPKSWYESTQTDFCVIATKPWKTRTRPLISPPASFRPDHRLPLCKVFVQHDDTAARREIVAISKFCDESFRKDLLDEIRMALRTDPSKAPATLTRDLTRGRREVALVDTEAQLNQAKYQSMIGQIRNSGSANTKQLEVLESATKMPSNIVTVNGPPGVGKTRTLVDLVISLAEIGHKILVCANANSAVDTDAAVVLKRLSLEQKRRIKFLRLEADGTEKRAVLRKKNYAQYADVDPQNLPEHVKEPSAQDNAAIRNVLERISSDYAAYHAQMDQLIAQYKGIDEALKHMDRSKIKRSGCPVGMTYDYRVWQQCEDDKAEAILLREQARQTMPPQEFQARISKPSAFDRSFEFRRIMRDYIARDAELSKEELKVYEEASEYMFWRILSDTTILFATASNCGGTRLIKQDAFQPSMICCDNSTQISLPALCVPLTTFTEWEGLFLFGDVRQLEPVMLAGTLNEFRENAKLSPLSLPHSKGHLCIELDMQYRMAPAIRRFLSEQFYDDIVKDHPSMLPDNPRRAAMRRISKKYFTAAQKPSEANKREGSEYFFLNVPYGASRIENNGVSLVNYANANAIMNLVKQMIDEDGITPELINIITYYKGQLRLLKRKIQGFAWSEDGSRSKEIAVALEVSTVDAFQGKESEIVIVDTVVARDAYLGKTQVISQDDDEDNNDTEDYIKPGTATRFVRNPHRLCVALSQGGDGLVVVGQQYILARGSKQRMTKLAIAIANMVVDAEANGLIADDLSEDTSPTAEWIRAQTPEETLRARLRDAETKRFHSVSHARANYVTTKNYRADFSRDLADQVPVLRGHRGVTTRPNDSSQFRERADAFDDEKRKIERAKAEQILQQALHPQEGFPPFSPREMPELTPGVKLPTPGT